MAERTIDFSMQAQEAASILGKLAAKLQSDGLAEACKGVIAEYIADSFNNEVDTAKRPWKPLAPSTLARKRKKGLSLRILVATGTGKKSIKLTTVGKYKIVVSYIGYMSYHDSPEARKKLPRRQFTPDKADFDRGQVGKDIAKALDDYLNPSLASFALREIARTPLLSALLR